MPEQQLFAYLHVKNAPAALAFYADVFGATETMRLVEPGSGRVGHAQLDFGGTTLMLADEFPEHGMRGARPDEPVSVSIHLHVNNCDEVIERAVHRGATLVMPPRDMFYGERSGVIRDPFGHRWSIGHPIEAVTPEEMQRRYDATITKGK
jgi:uncharacterized glyoxalase superfamily protein PhnB